MRAVVVVVIVTLVSAKSDLLAALVFGLALVGMLQEKADV